MCAEPNWHQKVSTLGRAVICASIDSQSSGSTSSSLCLTSSVALRIGQYDTDKPGAWAGGSDTAVYSLPLSHVRIQTRWIRAPYTLKFLLCWRTAMITFLYIMRKSISCNDYPSYCSIAVKRQHNQSNL